MVSLAKIAQNLSPYKADIATQQAELRKLNLVTDHAALGQIFDDIKGYLGAVLSTLDQIIDCGQDLDLDESDPNPAKTEVLLNNVERNLIAARLAFTQGDSLSTKILNSNPKATESLSDLVSILHSQNEIFLEAIDPEYISFERLNTFNHLGSRIVLDGLRQYYDGSNSTNPYTDLFIRLSESEEQRKRVELIYGELLLQRSGADISELPNLAKFEELKKHILIDSKESRLRLSDSASFVITQKALELLDQGSTMADHNQQVMLLRNRFKNFTSVSPTELPIILNDALEYLKALDSNDKASDPNLIASTFRLNPMPSEYIFVDSVKDIFKDSESKISIVQIKREFEELCKNPKPESVLRLLEDPDSQLGKIYQQHKAILIQVSSISQDGEVEVVDNKGVRNSFAEFLLSCAKSLDNKPLVNFLSGLSASPFRFNTTNPRKAMELVWLLSRGLGKVSSANLFRYLDQIFKESKINEINPEVIFPKNILNNINYPKIKFFDLNNKNNSPET